MRNIGKWPAMEERRIALKRLDKIGLDCLGKQHRHRTISLQIARSDWLAVTGIGDNDPAKPFFKIPQIAGQAEDRHHFGGNRNVKAAFARISVCYPANGLDDIPQRPVIHVNHAPPDNAPDIDAKAVAPVNMIIDHRREQIMGCGDGMEIAREMEIDILHRRNLGMAAASRTTLGAKAWAK